MAPNLGRALQSGIARGMTCCANRFVVGSDQSIRRVLDSVIAMAGHATGETCRRKSRGMRALVEQLRLEYMASRADIFHIGNPGRGCAMISVTRTASGSTQIASFYHGFVMNAFAVVGELRDRDTIGLHGGGVSMTVAAGCGDVKRIYKGTNVAGRTDFMNAMTICADGDFCISGGELSPVHARAVLRELVGAQRGVVLAHVSRVGVTFAAEFGNLLPRNFAFEARLRAHGIIGTGGIPAVTTHARQPFLRMNVGGKELGADFQGFIERRVAIETGVWRFGKGKCQ